MVKDPEYLAKAKMQEVEDRLERGVDDAASSLRRTNGSTPPWR